MREILNYLFEYKRLTKQEAEDILTEITAGKLSDAEIAEVNIPTGIPLLYEFDEHFEPIKKGGAYLDPAAAQAAITAVANQGKA